MAKKILGEEKGSVMIMVVIALFVLVGFTGLVIDGGSAYLTKSRLQNAADAAALAGAQGLPTAGTAANNAVTYANANGMEPLWGDVTSSGNTYTAARADDIVVAQIVPASEGSTTTQLKYTQADLDKLREQFQATLNAMGNAELMALADSYPISYEKTETTTGYTYADLDGKTPAELMALANQYSVTEGLSNLTMAEIDEEIKTLTTTMNMAKYDTENNGKDTALIAYMQALISGGLAGVNLNDYTQNKNYFKNIIADNKQKAKDAIIAAKRIQLTFTDRTALINALLKKAPQATETVLSNRDKLIDDIIAEDIDDLRYDTETVETGGHPIQIKVTCTRTLDNAFMSLLGFPTQTVSAVAVAENPGFMGDTMPFINWDPYEIDDEIILWDKEGSGNFECLIHAPHNPYYHFDPAVGAEKKNGKVANIKKELEDICIPGAVVYVISLKNDEMVDGNEIPTSRGSFVYPSANTKNKAIIGSEYLALLKCTVISYDSKTIGLRIDESYEDLSPTGIEEITGRPRLVE